MRVARIVVIALLIFVAVAMAMCSSNEAPDATSEDSTTTSVATDQPTNDEPELAQRVRVGSSGDSNAVDTSNDARTPAPAFVVHDASGVPISGLFLGSKWSQLENAPPEQYGVTNLDGRIDSPVPVNRVWVHAIVDYLEIDENGVLQDVPRACSLDIYPIDSETGDPLDVEVRVTDDNAPKSFVTAGSLRGSTLIVFPRVPAFPGQLARLRIGVRRPGDDGPWSAPVTYEFHVAPGIERLSLTLPITEHYDIAAEPDERAHEKALYFGVEMSGFLDGASSSRTPLRGLHSLRVIVRDLDDELVTGARVDLIRFGLHEELERTDSSGAASFSGIPAGNYTIRSGAAGLYFEELDVVVGEGEPNEVTPTPLPTLDVTLTAVDGHGGRVPHATVRVFLPEGMNYANVLDGVQDISPVTDRHGRVTLHRVLDMEFAATVVLGELSAGAWFEDPTPEISLTLR